MIDATRPDRSVLLTASAGTGKTYVLTRRLVHLLATVAAPSDIAAVTFTEKAAAEMKARLYELLADAAWADTPIEALLGAGHGLPPDSPQARQGAGGIFSCLLSEPDALRLTTVHSFCLGILRQFPVEAGLCPDFSVVDPMELEIRRGRAADACLESIPGGPLEREFRKLLSCGLTTHGLRGLLVSALGKRGLIEKAAIDAGGHDGFIAALADGTPRLEAALRSAMSDVGRPAAGYLDFLNTSGLAGFEDFGPDVIRAIETYASSSDPAAAAGAFKKARGLFYTNEDKLTAKSALSAAAAKRALGNMPAARRKTLCAEHDGLYFILRDAVSALAAAYDRFVEAEALAAFLPLYRAAEDAYTGSNRASGEIDFDDIELLTYRLLSGPDGQGVLYKAEERTVHCLVDEFQDTSDLQWEILERLSSEAFAGQGVEGDRAPSFFAVGDVKQSIYRFRKADYRLTGLLRQKMLDCIEPGRRAFPELTKNYRSSPAVVEFVNRTFAGLLDGYPAAEAIREGAAGGVRLRVSADDEPGALADEVAAAFGLPITTPEGGKTAGWSDMAILVRSRTRLSGYQAALAACGIGYRVLGGVGFFEQEEVRAVLSAASFIDDRSNRQPLAVFLKSRLCDLSDDDILPVYSAEDPAGAVRLVSPDAGAMLTGWLVEAGRVPAGRLVRRIIEDSRAVEVYGRALGPQAVLNIEKLVSLARSYDRRGGLSLSDFIAWAAERRELSDTAAADVELPDRELVTIMTVHSAKGLEFPVVFLPGGDSRPGGGRSDGLIVSFSGGDVRLAVKTGALLPPGTGFAEMKAAEEAEADGEAARLFYVATTRARDYLVITASGGKKPGRSSWLAMLSASSPDGFMDGYGPGDDFISDFPEARPQQSTPPPAPARPDVSARPPDSRLAPLPAGPGIVFSRPSSLVDAGFAGIVHASVADTAAALLRGTAVHACLESFGKTGEYDAYRAVQRASYDSVEAGRIAPADIRPLAAGIEAALGRLLSVPGFRALVTGGPGRYFELPLSYMRGGEIVTGTADLVIVENGAARVIDFKSGYEDVPDDAVAGSYRPQVTAYCAAVKEAFGLKNVAGYLLLVDRPALIPL